MHAFKRTLQMMINFNQFYQRISKSKSVSQRPNSAFMNIYTPKTNKQYSQSLIHSQQTENEDHKYRKKHDHLRSSSQSQNCSIKRQKKSLKSSPNKEKYKYQVLNLHCLKRVQLENPPPALAKLYHNKQMRPVDICKKKEDRARQKQFLGKKFKCLINRQNRIRTQPLQQNECSFTVSGFKIL